MMEEFINLVHKFLRKSKKGKYTMNISELSSGIPIFVIGDMGFKVFKD